MFREPRLVLRYVLFDPEVESFSFELENRHELVEFAADLLGCPASMVARWADEAETDPDLVTARRPFRWSAKRNLPLANRLLWYVVARALKPSLIVETGVHDGLGSLVLLTALKHNRQDGHPGRLISFDLYPDTGWLVPAHLASDWTFVEGSTADRLDVALAGSTVGMSVHDTPPTPELQAAEFTAVLRRRAARLAIVNSSGAQLPVLTELTKREGGRFGRFEGRSKNHIHPGGPITLAVFE